MHIPPPATRIQFNRAFGFQSLRKILNYLADLGISDIYASPVFKATKGSPHGYDIVDLCQLNPELGTEDDFSDLTDEAKRNGLGGFKTWFPTTWPLLSTISSSWTSWRAAEASKYLPILRHRLGSRL